MSKEKTPIEKGKLKNSILQISPLILGLMYVQVDTTHAQPAPPTAMIQQSAIPPESERLNLIDQRSQDVKYHLKWPTAALTFFRLDENGKRQFNWWSLLAPLQLELSGNNKRIIDREISIPMRYSQRSTSVDGFTSIRSTDYSITAIEIKKELQHQLNTILHGLTMSKQVYRAHHAQEQSPTMQVTDVFIQGTTSPEAPQQDLSTQAPQDNYFSTRSNIGKIDGTIYRDHNEWRKVMAVYGYPVVEISFGSAQNSEEQPVSNPKTSAESASALDPGSFEKENLKLALLRAITGSVLTIYELKKLDIDVNTAFQRINSSIPSGVMKDEEYDDIANKLGVSRQEFDETLRMVRLGAQEIPFNQNELVNLERLSQNYPGQSNLEQINNLIIAYNDHKITDIQVIKQLDTLVGLKRKVDVAITYEGTQKETVIIPVPFVFLVHLVLLRSVLCLLSKPPRTT